MDAYIYQHLQELLNNPKTRMRTTGHNTWEITTNNTPDGTAIYKNPAYQENQQLKDKIEIETTLLNTANLLVKGYKKRVHNRNIQIKDLKANRCLYDTNDSRCDYRKIV